MLTDQENIFVKALALTESDDNPYVLLGDNGRGAGRFQWHPDAYFSWAPTLSEFKELGPNPTWDQCFEFAVRAFFRKASEGKPLADIAMAYHLHGQHIYEGDDPPYRTRFLTKLAEVQNAN